LKGTGGGLVLLYRKTLDKAVSVVKCVEDTLIWLKIEQQGHPNVYICFAYIPHDHNVYYTKYDSDLFDCILKDMSIFTQNGTVIVAGDLNSRVRNLPDYIEEDFLATPVHDMLSNDLIY
jgi:endonuclease/exonuclease/phosphatase (EEP) superfamily protein YafD